jgi:RHS repeat-associated protein
MDVPEEIVQENHYYPFGLNTNYSWMNNTTLLDNRYQYNGKELNDDFGLNWIDYGARWYDAAVGRWWSVDPMAGKYVRWSGYNYVLGNPIKLIDPDGRSVDDIIISNKDPEAFYNLKKLTNDELTMDPFGVVTIAKLGGANTDMSLTEGSKLIRELIKDNNKTTIILGMDRGNGTFAVNESTNTELRTDPKEKVEYGANVYIKGTDPSTANADGTRGLKDGAFITLGHELSHAFDLVKGKFDKTVLSPVIDFDQTPAGVNNQFTRREFKTRVFENKLREEQGLRARALPLPLNILKYINF